MRRLRWTALWLCCAATSCQSLTQVPASAMEALDLAETLISQGEYDVAVETLEYFGVTPLAQENAARWYLLGGTAMHKSGDSWDGYVLFSEFIRDTENPRETPPALADLTYEIGRELSRSTSAFWPFYSDRERGRTVLTDFVTVFSNRHQMPDALHRLGEMAYEDGRFDMAIERFSALIRGHPRSIWKTKAGFRVAMCHYRKLQGPAYDLEGMDRALNELTDFLNPTGTAKPENVKFVAEASAALSTVRSWLAEKQVSIADFYFTLKNRVGGEHHLRIAATQFGETDAGRIAQARLDRRAERAAQRPESPKAPENGSEKTPGGGE